MKIMRSQAPVEWWTAGWSVWAWKSGGGGRFMLISKHNSGSDHHSKILRFQTHAVLLVDHLDVGIKCLHA